MSLLLTRLGCNGNLSGKSKPREVSQGFGTH
jgi:hypothetical protein